jgi:hypothetical protein
MTPHELMALHPAVDILEVHGVPATSTAKVAAVFLDADRCPGDDEEVNRLLRAEVISYHQAALDAHSPLAIDEFLQLARIRLGRQIGSPADQDAPDLPASLDKPRFSPRYSRGAASSPGGATRSVASATFGWAGDSVRVRSSKMTSREASPA